MEGKEQFSSKLFRILKPYFALVAIFVTAVLAIFLGVKFFVPAETPQDKFAENIEWYLNDLTEEQIIELEKIAENSIVDEQAYEQEIINYLLNEGIENELLFDTHQKFKP